MPIMASMKEALEIALWLEKNKGVQVKYDWIKALISPSQNSSKVGQSLDYDNVLAPSSPLPYQTSQQCGDADSEILHVY